MQLHSQAMIQTTCPTGKRSRTPIALWARSASKCGCSFANPAVKAAVDAFAVTGRSVPTGTANPKWESTPTLVGVATAG